MNNIVSRNCVIPTTPMQLLEWNKMQQKLWSSLITQGIVNRNDWYQFRDFAIWFAAFYQRNNRPPSEEETRFYVTMRQNNVTATEIEYKRSLGESNV